MKNLLEQYLERKKNMHGGELKWDVLTTADTHMAGMVLI